MDGVVPIGVETGLMKAKTALYARHAVERRGRALPDVEGRADPHRPRHATQGLSYYFVGGGVPIVLENQLIGAIGVGGGNMDEPCAYAALSKVLGIQPPPPAPAARRRRPLAAAARRRRRPRRPRAVDL